MKKLRQFRRIISLVMLIECLALAFLGIGAPVHARVAGGMQLSLGAAAGSVAAIGAWILWMLATLLLGRVYCGAFCPLGAMQDASTRLGRLLRRKPRPRRKLAPHRSRWWILAAYAAAVLLSAGIVPLLLEPWPAFQNIVQQCSGHGADAHSIAALLGVGLAWGLVCGVVSLLLITTFALLRGRDFCNDICPVGSILSLASARPLMHIELYPDRCTSCLRCEEVCKAGCIDIKTRTIDDACCLRCFSCIAECPEDALRFQINPNGIITPMLHRSDPTV